MLQRKGLAMAGVAAVALVALAVSATSALASFNVGGVVATGQLASTQPPWYVWNSKTCTMHTTTKHPAKFVASLHKISGFKLAYMPEATGDPYDDSLNAATKKAAISAGMSFYQFSNAYPSTTAPLTVVGEANTIHASAAIEANVIPQQYPAIQAALKKDCIPWLNEYDVPGSKHIPVFQTNNLGTGQGMAQAAVPIMKSRGWVASQTYIVTCADPSVGTNLAGVYGIDVGYRKAVAKLFPGSHIVTPDLTCGSSGIDGARSQMADWLTAHPEAKYVTAVSHIDSSYSLGMADALQAAGYTNNALVAGRGGDSGYIKQIASGDPIVAVDGDPQFTKWGVPIVAMAEALALGKPVPAFVSPQLVVVTKANAKKYGG